MPYKSLRKCSHPGCDELVKSGRCAQHPLVVRDPAIKQLYNSPQWRYMRAAQLGQHPWCVDCLAIGQYTFASEVDHVKPHHGKSELFFDEHNLQSLCKPHHSAKTAQETLHAP